MWETHTHFAYLLYYSIYAYLMLENGPEYLLGFIHLGGLVPIWTN